MTGNAMHRRSFLTLLGGAAAAWPLATSAQQRPVVPVVGFLSGVTSGSYATPEFRQGLSQAGYVEGRNVALEYHWADFQYDRLPALAADLVRRQVSVIVMSGISAALAAKAATTTIPIVFQVGVNPVQMGLVASLNRPGGNLTGVIGLASELMAKQLELLHQVVPTVTVIAALANPTQPNAVNSSNNLHAAARILGMQLHHLNASTERDFDTVFTTLQELRAGGLVIATDGFLNSRTAQLAELALRQAVPTISPNRSFAAAGGLMSTEPTVWSRNARLASTPAASSRCHGAAAGSICPSLH